MCTDARVYSPPDAGLVEIHAIPLHTVLCQLAKGTVYPIVQVINENIGHDWLQY